MLFRVLSSDKRTGGDEVWRLGDERKAGLVLGPWVLRPLVPVPQWFASSVVGDDGSMAMKPSRNDIYLLLLLLSCQVLNKVALIMFIHIRKRIGFLDSKFYDVTVHASSILHFISTNVDKSAGKWL